MALTISQLDGNKHANRIPELEAILQQPQANQLSGFWLAHPEAHHPGIALLVNGDLANLYYFPNEGPPTRVSKGPAPGLDPNGTTLFSHGSPEQAQQILNTQVIPFSLAVTVAKEFFTSKDLPKSIEWLEL